MRILATADIHSPKYLKKFEQLLDKHRREIESVDVILIAGDLMEKGDLNGLKQLVETIRKFTNVPIYACPGNEDYDESIEKAKNLIRDVKWLIDEIIELKIRDLPINLIGSKGVLDKPTFWQMRHIKNIREIYEKRLQLLIEMIRKLNDDNINILLLHYAPTYATLEGENRKIWCFLGTSKLEKYIAEKRMLVIHGHAHKSHKRIVKLGRSIIINASFPELFDLYMIDVLENEYEVNILKSSGEIVKFREKVEKKGTSILDYV